MKISINYSITYEIDVELDDKFKALETSDDEELLDELITEACSKTDEVPVTDFDGAFYLNSIWSEDKPLYIND